MMIKMLVGLSGPTYSLGPGDEKDFPQDEAIRFINAGYAAPVVEREVERAVLAPVIETREATVPQVFINRKNRKNRR